jgi:hypothetical protein
MSNKELLMSEIEQIPEAFIGELLKLVKSFKKSLPKVKTWKGRPVLTEDDMKKIDCPYPPEPELEEWKKMLQSEEK